MNFLSKKISLKKKSIIFDDKNNQLNIEELNNFSKKINKTLKKKNRLVLVFSENTIEFLIGYYSFLNLGLAQMILNSQTYGEDLKKILKNYRPTYIYISKKIFILNKIFLSRFKIVGEIKENLILIYKKKNDYKINKKLALLISTSASTGSQKFVRISHNNLIDNTQKIVKALKISSSDTSITTMPPNYTYGLSVINTHLLQGGNIILTNNSVFEKNFWEMVKNFKVTNINGVPYFYEILKKLKISREKLPNLKFFTSAGGGLDGDVYEYFKNFVLKFNIKFFCMYGQTEATSRISILNYKDFHKKFGSLGKALDEGNLYIDKNKNTGELCYKGKNVCLGYAKNYKDLNKGDENKGILKTGDIAKKYKNDFYIVGRKKRFAKVYGHRINLDEIQKKLQDSKMKCVCIEKNNQVYLLTDNKKNINKIKKELEKQNLNQNYFKTLFVKQFIYNSNGKISYSMMEKSL